MSEPQTTTANAPPPTPELKGDIKTLKDAFPDLDVEVIETILDSQGGNLDATFEVLLGMSDPTYKPTPQEIEGLSQLRQDEEYARRLAREGDAHYPQNNNNNDNNNTQPLFNLQEELPIIKEKVIEAGTAAKNKIMSFYNQLMAPPSEQSSSSNGGVLESRMGNLSLSENQRPVNTMNNSNSYNNNNNNNNNVDLYEWDGRGNQTRNPLLTPQKDIKTSTSNDQLLSDEEFARQLAREDAQAAESPRRSVQNSPPVEQPKPQVESDHSDVSFSALRDEPTKETESHEVGYNVRIEEDDLDDLFDKQDSVPDLKQLDESSETVTKKN